MEITVPQTEPYEVKDSPEQTPLCKHWPSYQSISSFFHCSEWEKASQEQNHCVFVNFDVLFSIFMTL